MNLKEALQSKPGTIFKHKGCKFLVAHEQVVCLSGDRAGDYGYFVAEEGDYGEVVLMLVDHEDIEVEVVEW